MYDLTNICSNPELNGLDRHPMLLYDTWPNSLQKWSRWNFQVGKEIKYFYMDLIFKSEALFHLWKVFHPNPHVGNYRIYIFVVAVATNLFDFIPFLSCFLSWRHPHCVEERPPLVLFLSQPEHWQAGHELPVPHQRWCFPGDAFQPGLTPHLWNGQWIKIFFHANILCTLDIWSFTFFKILVS